MTLDDFWALIEQSSVEQSATAARLPVREWRAGWLSNRLATLPPEDIIEFELHLAAQRERVDTWEMWGVGHCLMQGLCTDDSFFYLQPWLVGLGRETFERVAADPDTLADVPEVRRLAGRPVNDWADDEFPEWELLNYAASEAYEMATGVEGGLDEALEDRGLERAFDADPDGEPWDHESAAERRTRFPRLSALLG